MKKRLLSGLVVTLSVAFNVPSHANDEADCPVASTIEGRMRIADGEPSCEEIAKRAIPARQISPAEKKRIMAAFDALLIDGPSARWRWGEVTRGELACLWINSKNRMGGYSGWSEYTFNLKTGEVQSGEELAALLARLGMADQTASLCGPMPSP